VIGQEQGEKIVNIHLAGRFTRILSLESADRAVSVAGASGDGNIFLSVRLDLILSGLNGGRD
jgi:hypothetical protein